MQLSAFVDGELPENEKELLLRRLSQDAGLRQQVAEYLAIGRAVRGENQIGGVNELRERVANRLGEKPVQDDHVESDSGRERLVRPLSGIAIAATVAFVAILGLREVTDVDVPEETTPDAVVERTEFPTQPDADDLLRQYGLMHDAFASDHGANSIKTRLTTLELRQADVEDAEKRDEAEPDEKTAEDNESE